MKRFMLFSGRNYYPKGGMQDFRGSFDTLEEAESENRKSLGTDWWEIFDNDLMKDVT
jgi:hypothetical protein